jgi:homoserine O-acetyltransferase
MTMTKSNFASSDSLRTAKPLTHALDVRFEGTQELELGGSLRDVNVRYETYGRLSPNRDNAVLICHALSGDSHVARHDDKDDPGWWDVAVGPGKPVDTDRYFVICPNILGGCRGTTGPNSVNPETGNRYGRQFPTITVGDMVTVHKRLLDHLGIPRLRAVVGGSLGGQMVLCWADRFPGSSAGYLPIATASRLTSQSLAFDIVGRNAILRDPDFHDGQYYDRPHGPDTGLAIARMIGHITYLSRESMQIKFDTDRHSPRDIPTSFEKRFSVGSYLGYQGDRFVERFDANSYIVLTLAMDLFDLGATRDALSSRIGRSDDQWLILSFTSDWLFPPEESWRLVESLVSAGRRVSYCNVGSRYGHDAFLLEHDVAVYGELIRSFIGNLGAQGSDAGYESFSFAAVPGTPAAEENVDRAAGSAARENPERPESAPDRGSAEASPGNGGCVQQDPASIFHPDRLDHDRIVELIPTGSSVLDLGCGCGELLYRLRKSGCDALTGVELDEKAIIACTRLGLDVIHADLNRHLDLFGDESYDYVVLSRTLQSILNIEGLLGEIVRIGRRAVVSFPNFAYHKLRRMLAEQGRSPESKGVLRYKWYDTPNLRFFTIADFEDFCAEHSIRIHRVIAMDTEERREVTEDPNANADLSIFVISR